MAGGSSDGMVRSMPEGLEAAVDAYIAAWNSPDPAERARLLARAVSDDFEFHGPTGTFRGREALAALIVALQTRMAGATVVRLGPVTEGVFRWAVLAPAGTSLLEGTDEAEVAGDGRLRRISVAAIPPSG